MVCLSLKGYQFISEMRKYRHTEKALQISGNWGLYGKDKDSRVTTEDAHRPSESQLRKPVLYAIHQWAEAQITATEVTGIDQSLTFSLHPDPRAVTFL